MSLAISHRTMSDGRCFADPDRNSVSFHLARGNDLPQIEVGATAVDSGITIQPNLAWRDSAGRARQRRRGLRAPGRRVPLPLYSPRR